MADDEKQAKPKPKAPPKRWGFEGDAVLEKLQRAAVTLQMADGTSIVGYLVGYNEYTVTIKNDDGIAVVNKGHVVVLRPKKREDTPA